MYGVIMTRGADCRAADAVRTKRDELEEHYHVVVVVACIVVVVVVVALVLSRCTVRRSPVYSPGCLLLSYRQRLKLTDMMALAF